MTIIEVANEMNMINSDNQWLFLVSNPRKTNVTQLISYIKEGGNVAISTNNTVIDGSCMTGEDCLYHELLKNFVMALSKLVREEEAIFSQISDEEWESIRLSKRERRDSMLEFIKVKYKMKPFDGYILVKIHKIVGSLKRSTIVQTVRQLEIRDS